MTTDDEHDPDCGLALDHPGDCATADFVHTAGSRERALRRMRFAIDQFYAFAQIIGNHTFLEFAGLMSAYVTSCQAMHERGVDFMTEHMEIEDHRAGYLGEKLHCIYGDALKKPENWAAFCKALGIATTAEEAPAQRYAIHTSWGSTGAGGFPTTEQGWHIVDWRRWEGTLAEAREIIRKEYPSSRGCDVEIVLVAEQDFRHGPEAPV